MKKVSCACGAASTPTSPAGPLVKGTISQQRFDKNVPGLPEVKAAGVIFTTSPIKWSIKFS